MGRAGYRTFLTGKWHNDLGVIARDFQTARDVFLGGMSDPMRAPLRQLLEGRLSEPEPAGRHCCERFADAAIEFLKEARADQPFFCYLPFAAPHDPHIVPKDFPVRYPADARMLPDNFQPIHPWDNGEMTIRDEALLPWPRTPEAVQEMNAEYWRYVSYLDHQVGRVLEALQQSPHAENTLVIFTADSGVARGSHGLIGKQNCYEHSLRVPCIVSGPGLPKGKTTDALCYLYDLLPTVGALCDVPPPEGSEGVAMDQVVRHPGSSDPNSLGSSSPDPASQGRTSLVFGYREDQRAWCDRRWKLIRYPKIDVTQLFDLQEDPSEKRDLSGLPEHQQQKTELLQRMAEELADLGDSVSLDGPVTRPAKWTPPTR
jgi:arylsulfatase A-like enzyme